MSLSATSKKVRIDEFLFIAYTNLVLTQSRSMHPHPLAQAKVEQTLQVVELRAESSLLERLRGMGFGRGRVLEILLDEPKRPLVIGFIGSGQRVALAREIAEFILVRSWVDQEVA